MDAKQKLALKGRGFIPQKEDGYFNMRVITDCGNLTAQQLRVLAEIAQEYGRGYLGATTRLTVELPWIKAEDVETVAKLVSDAGMQIGGTGKRVRAVVACKGTICPSGLCDTQGIGREIARKYFGMELPTKFKIGVVGCPNNCAKAQLNDFGLMGQRVPSFHREKCVNCGKCVTVCRAKALKKEDKTLIFHQEQCVNCGKCIDACKLGAMTESAAGLAVYVGGKFGRQIRIGDRLEGLYPVERAVELVDRTIRYFKENGREGERFSSLLDRVGTEELVKILEA